MIRQGLEVRQNPIVDIPGYQIPVTQLGEVKTINFNVFLAYRYKLGKNKKKLFQKIGRGSFGRFLGIPIEIV